MLKVLFSLVPLKNKAMSSTKRRSQRITHQIESILLLDGLDILALHSRHLQLGDRDVGQGDNLA
jgi:hypothetical protein